VKRQDRQAVLALRHSADKNLFLNVAVSDFRGKAALRQRFLDLFAEHDGTVFAASAADGDRQITFAFADVVRDQVGEEAFDATEKFAALRERANVLLDFGIFASVAAQGRDEMRVWQKAHVENQVGVGGHAVLVAKANDGDQHGAVVGILEALGNKVTEFMDVELRGVNHHIGQLADGLHERALVAQTFANGQSFAEGVRPARLAIAAEERVIAGIDEDQRDGMILAKVLQQSGELFELRSFARIHQQGGAAKVAFAGGVQFRKNGHQLDGEVIDTVEAHVFEGAEDGAFSGAGNAGEDNEVARVVSGGLLHVRRALSSSPGAGECWECACLRDIWRRCGG